MVSVQPSNIFYFSIFYCKVEKAFCFSYSTVETVAIKLLKVYMIVTLYGCIKLLKTMRTFKLIVITVLIKNYYKNRSSCSSIAKNIPIFIHQAFKKPF